MIFFRFTQGVLVLFRNIIPVLKYAINHLQCYMLLHPHALVSTSCTKRFVKLFSRATKTLHVCEKKFL